MIMDKNDSQEGFTLVEVLIALFILTVGILGAAVMQIAAINGNSTAMRLTDASSWASDAHEALIALPFTLPGAATPTDPLLLDDNGDGLAGLDNTDIAGSPADGGPVLHENYTVFWNVADDYPITNCKTIRVIVRYNDKGINKTVTQNFTKKRTL